MTDEGITPNGTAQPDGSTIDATPAGAQNTEPGADDSTTQTVPYVRFKEVNDQLKALKTEQEKRAKADADAEEARLKDQGKHEELAAKEKERADAATQRANGLLMRFEFSAAVNRQKLVFADSMAADDAFSLADMAGITVKDDVVDPGAMDDVVKALVKARPYLLKQVGAQDNDAGAGVGEGGETPEQKTAYQEDIKQRYRL